jgi:hypothetical protein
MPGISERFGGFSPFYLQIFEICAIMNSKNDKAAERAQLNEADTEKRRAPARSVGSTRARRCGRTGQAKENPLYNSLSDLTPGLRPG